MSQPFIGEIKMFAGNFAPRGYAFCNGQLLSIAQNTALFSILGTTYGGNGQTTFGLPNLQGRFPMHWGSGPGLTPRQLGETGGIERVTLLTSQLPAHVHGINLSINPPCSNLAGNSDVPTGNVPAASGQAENFRTPPGNAAMAPIPIAGNTGAAGNNTPVEIINPFQCVSFIIALQGIFPSRN